MEVEITSLNAKGRGMAGSVEIPGTVPGDLVLAQVKRRRGRLLEVLKPSPMRTSARCAHVGECGGCALQSMRYKEQLKWKEERLRQLFPSMLPIIPCDDPWRYRNKMEFSFSQDAKGNRYLGLMKGRGRVVDLDECHLVSPWFSQTLASVRKWWQHSNIPAFHPPSNRGILRTLTLREGRRTGDRLAMLTVSHACPLIDPKLFNGAVYVLQVQYAQKGTPTYFETSSGHITERLEIPGLSPLTFRIGPTAFFQPNTYQAEILYHVALKLADIDAKSTVFDLYCGTGTLSILAATLAKRVVGIELNEEACQNARANAKLNHINNVEFIQSDVGAYQWLERPDVVFVDPPRVGLSPEAIEHLLAIRPKKIIYISCNPTTQAANILDLTGYRLTALQPVDQFPHTPHIESVAALEDILNGLQIMPIKS